MLPSAGLEQIYVILIPIALLRLIGFVAAVPVLPSAGLEQIYVILIVIVAAGTAVVVLFLPTMELVLGLI